jgi:hypothetical protein
VDELGEVGVLLHCRYYYKPAKPITYSLGHSDDLFLKNITRTARCSPRSIPR